MNVPLFSVRATGDVPLGSGAARQPPGAPHLGRPAELAVWREATALLLFASSVFITLALASVRMDPSDAAVRGADWVGPVGAWLATALVRGFGVIAWLVPVECCVLGAPLYRRVPAQAPTGLRLSGDLLVLIVAAALVHVALPDVLVFGRAPAGGNVGLFFGELLQALFSTAGSFIVGGTVIGLVLIGRSSFSFLHWLEVLRRSVQRLGAGLALFGARLGRAWSEATLLRRRRQQDEAQGAPPEHAPTGDAAILARLEDVETECSPVERTGTPPLAIAVALRHGLAEEASALLAQDERPSPEPSPEPDEVGEAARERRRSAAHAAAPEAGAPTSGPGDAALLEQLCGAPEPAEPGLAPGAAEGASPALAARPDEPRAGESRAGESRAAESRASEAVPALEIVDTSSKRTVRRSAELARPRKARDFILPSTELLEPAPPAREGIDKERVHQLAARLEKTLADYGVSGKVAQVQPGPTVTTYEVEPAAGTKVSKIASLSDDLALGLSRTVRIIAPIPGKSRVGFELPNDERLPVSCRELIEDERFEKLAAKVPLPVVLGRDIVGAPFYADLASMPHVIVAGATGAGKSVGLNVMLSSLLFHRTPEDLRLLMIDPKVVELAPFDGIPHMLLPVVTDMKQAATALKWAVDEMERRYQLFANAGTKNIGTYNRWAQRVCSGELPPPPAAEVEALAADGAVVTVPSAKEGSDGAALPGRLPFIVVVVDEFADLMMQQGKEVEVSVARLAQKARAAGIHVVLATQRPSVDVITGMIKANFPTRIAFRVAQKVDSRTILDEQGAELLLGRGDMLVKMNGDNDTRRVQCPFISEEEVAALTDYLRSQGTPVYHDAILAADAEEGDAAADEPSDARYDEAVRVVAETGRCSTSWLQRKMTIGYNRAAKIVEMMERQGVVGPANGSKDREVFITGH